MSARPAAETGREFGGRRRVVGVEHEEDEDQLCDENRYDDADQHEQHPEHLDLTAVSRHLLLFRFCCDPPHGGAAPVPELEAPVSPPAGSVAA